MNKWASIPSRQHYFLSVVQREKYMDVVLESDYNGDNTTVFQAQLGYSWDNWVLVMTLCAKHKHSFVSMERNRPAPYGNFK